MLVLSGPLLGFIFLIIFLCIISDAIAKSPLNIGPIHIVVKSIEPCPKNIQGENGIRLLNFHGFNPKDEPYKFIFSADAFSDFSIDDRSIVCNLHLAQWVGRGRWRPGVHDMRFPQTCISLSTFAKPIWDPLAVQIYGRKVGCPIPAVQNSHLRNVSIDTRTPYAKEFFYGRWRGDVIIQNITDEKQTTVGCLRVFSETVPP